MTTVPAPARRQALIPVTVGRRAYGSLLAAAPATGRCPVVISEAAATGLPPGRDIASALLDVSYRDAGSELAARWPGPCPSCPDCLAPFDDGFPGLLVARSFGGDPAAAAARLAGVPPGTVALAPTARPADVPAALGWCGTSGAWDDVAGLCAVLRSWEERFGALLVGLDADVLDLSVAAPPRTEEEALVVAAEHLAFCRPVYRERPLTLVRYARTLRGARRWTFGWAAS